MSTRSETVTITDGTAVSTVFALLPHERVVGVITPAIWTAADIGFQASLDGTTFFNIVDPARATATSFARSVNVATGAAAYYVVPEALDMPLESSMRITSLSTADNTSVNQSGANRTLTVVICKTF